MCCARGGDVVDAGPALVLLVEGIEADEILLGVAGNLRRCIVFSR